MSLDVGVIGLAVMGQNLVLNMVDHGYTVGVFNRTGGVTKAFVEGQGGRIVGAYTLSELISSLRKPRVLLMMVRAGEGVDQVIHEVQELLEEGDILIDGGNSYYRDTIRRGIALRQKGLHFLGVGISGGEEGARYGPSIMPGGAIEGWPHVKPLLQKIAAHVEGVPCCEWIGDSGSGHYVKMVHNGIEYGDIQLICEGYALLRDMVGLSLEEIAALFTSWNQRELKSYLIEIVPKVLLHQERGDYVIDHILDVAGYKGTGNWSVQDAIDLGVPLTLIGEAVWSRFLSSRKEERVKASQLYPQKKGISFDRDRVIESIFYALYASKIVSYAQGFMLLQAAAQRYDWDLHYDQIALLWRGGCIIRSQFLGKIAEAFHSSIPHLLFDDFFKGELLRAEPYWREIIALATLQGVPVPALSSALHFFDGYRQERLPASLLQGLRDYFGAHRYERTDRPRGEFFHTLWNTR